MGSDDGTYDIKLECFIETALGKNKDILHQVVPSAALLRWQKAGSYTVHCRWIDFGLITASAYRRKKIYLLDQLLSSVLILELYTPIKLQFTGNLRGRAISSILSSKLTKLRTKTWWSHTENSAKRRSA